MFEVENWIKLSIFFEDTAPSKQSQHDFPEIDETGQIKRNCFLKGGRGDT